MLFCEGEERFGGFFGDQGQVAGKVPLAEMDVPPGPPGGVGLNPGGWRLWSGYARLRSPGRYGLQVDGTSFSEVIIFRTCLSKQTRPADRPLPVTVTGGDETYLHGQSRVAGSWSRRIRTLGRRLSS